MPSDDYQLLLTRGKALENIFSRVYNLESFIYEKSTGTQHYYRGRGDYY